MPDLQICLSNKRRNTDSTAKGDAGEMSENELSDVVLMILSAPVIGYTVGTVVCTAAFNTVMYFTTLHVARKQDKWTPEQWQDKCNQYWRTNILKDDLKGSKKKYAKLLTEVMCRPGMYLGCKYLSLRGK